MWQPSLLANLLLLSLQLWKKYVQPRECFYTHTCLDTLDARPACRTAEGKASRVMCSLARDLPGKPSRPQHPSHSREHFASPHLRKVSWGSGKMTGLHQNCQEQGPESNSLLSERNFSLGCIDFSTSSGWKYEVSVEISWEVTAVPVLGRSVMLIIYSVFSKRYRIFFLKVIKNVYLN